MTITTSPSTQSRCLSLPRLHSSYCDFHPTNKPPRFRTHSLRLLQLLPSPSSSIVSLEGKNCCTGRACREGQLGDIKSIRVLNTVGSDIAIMKMPVSKALLRKNKAIFIRLSFLRRTRSVRGSSTSQMIRDFFWLTASRDKVWASNNS
eukprot:Skav225215  [mRNA]  locus=scaffold1041:250493:255815:+ [translate_table: standard]